MNLPSTRLVEQLLDRHGASLRAFFARRVRRRADAEELAQEVYVRLLRVPDPSAIQNPEAYLFTVATNLLREQAVQRQRDAVTLDVEQPSVEPQLATWPVEGGELDEQRRIERLREVLAQLPPKCQAVVKLQYWQGQSYAETAQALGISTNMVKKYLSQALVHCRRRMTSLR
jgi:RNA polymerase sigma-70 factor (ECF subfamily)